MRKMKHEEVVQCDRLSSEGTTGVSLKPLWMVEETVDPLRVVVF